MSLLDRFLRPLRTGVVTSGSPDEAPVLQPALRQLPRVDPVACTRAGACVEACPVGAISFTDDAWVVDAGRCFLCARCARACPEGAIAMTGGVLLAASASSGLLHVTPLREATR